MVRHVGNNWVLLAGVGLLFLVAAVIGLLGALEPGTSDDGAFGGNADDDVGIVPLYFIIATLVLAIVTGIWYSRHPPALHGSVGAYIVTAVTVETAVLFGGAIEGLQGKGAWVALGGGLIVYGCLELSRVTVTSGAVAALTGITATVVDLPLLDAGLQVCVAAIFAIAALRLLSIRRRQAAVPDGPISSAGKPRWS